MRGLLVACLVGLSAPLSAQSWRTEPVRSALLAVEADTTAGLERRWADGARRSDPAALLGLATLTRLHYRHAAADSLYSTVLGLAGVTDTLRVLAALGSADGYYYRGDLSAAARGYRGALALASALGDRSFITEARVGLAQALTWNESKSEADSIMHLTAADLPFLSPSLAAYVRCNRAGEPTSPGELEELEEARAGLHAAERAGDRRLIAYCTLQVASAHFRYGTMDSALILSERGALLQEQAHDQMAVGRTRGWRGYLLMTNGQYGLAREELDRAIQIGAAVQNLTAVSQAHMNLTAVYLRFGDIAAASGFAAQADSELRLIGNERALGTLRLLQGDLARMAGDTAGARIAYAQAIARGARYGGYPTVGPYRSLASMARARNDWAEAERLLVQGESLANRNALEVWAKRIQYDFGVLALEKNDLDRAEATFTRLREQLRPEESERGYAATVRLAEVALRRNDVDRATALMQQAADSLDARRARLGDRSLRLLLFQRRDDDADPDLAIASILAGMIRSGRAEDAFALAERRRARELSDRMLRLDVMRGAASMEASGTPEVGSAELARSLPDSATAVIEFVTGRGGEATVAFVLSRHGLQAAVLPPADSLLPDIERLQVFLASRYPASALQRRLGEALMQPVLALLSPEIQTLILVPDGPLHHVPFETLETGGGPIITRYAVSLLPSAAVGARLWARQSSTEPAEILALGDPRFNDAPSTGSEAAAFRAAFATAGGLTRLRHSGDEVKQIGRYAAHATVLRSGNATESFLRTRPLDRYRVIHFATHALVDERTAARSALALAPGDGEDGFVSAADLAGLDLHADLVVLSACRTAEGQVIDGEGVQGLTAPLLEAGARATVATRWPVSDDQTLEIVEAMYRGLASGLSAGAALQAAKLEAYRRGVPPAEWAAFVLVGDPSVRIPLQQPRGMTAARLAAALLVLLGIYGAVIVKRRRSDLRSPSAVRSARTHQT